MFGCLRRLGCLAVLAIAAALYLARDTWRPLVARFTRDDDAPATAGAAATTTVPTWQPVDQPSAARGEHAVRTLAAPRGPVYVNLRPGELASYAFLSLADALPPMLRDAETSVVGDRVYLRSVVAPADFAGVLGRAVRTVLHARDTLRLGGTVDVVRPGLAEFRVRDVRIGTVPVPTPLVPRVVSRFRQGELPPGVAEDAVPIQLPPYIGDVRVGHGRITLYKATP
ncbi:MAG TPA: hypothetical protein VGD56_16670 [Gemmatirosa sp.]